MPFRDVLWVDCIAALAAGLLVSLLSGWLSVLYAMPRDLVLVMGIANLCYGAYSFSLARRARRPLALIVVLVVANATWAVSCIAAAWVLRDRASVPGLVHLVGEGLFVGGLAWQEWIRRDRLRIS